MRRALHLDRSDLVLPALAVAGISLLAFAFGLVWLEPLIHGIDTSPGAPRGAAPREVFELEPSSPSRGRVRTHRQPGS